MSAVAPCLALVAPTGLSEADRNEWLVAALVTLDELKLDSDVLRSAAKAARHDPRCDHHSKIIPAMMRHINEHWGQAKQNHRFAAEFATTPAPREAQIAPPVEEIPMEELRTYSRDFLRMGLAKGWVMQAQYDAVIAERGGDVDEDDGRAGV